MSQILVTGEAKIRDIQGPVVANSGVVTALDGDASQYVRGDGTLADFPTSTGGGSSVSYYLNSSVSQGTIGGVAYKQLGKTPISGAGTDIAISTTGYIASYITDANDPALLEVPAGNFNCEFYFSVNNNTGNPFVYAEVYKYDGTTFTLIGTSVGVPEYITEGTVINPYYFAVPVATSVLTVTDRIAIRIYVNVDGRTVTLHTENNHLCQVVTTFSKGLISLNNLTRQNQFFGTGTSGTDFGISSSVATHTFNLPVASATNTGKLSSTDWSTFNGKQPAGNYVTLDTTQTITAAKTFSLDILVNSLTIGRGAGSIATNTSIGISALAANTTGSRNIAIGENALLSNTIGFNNIAIGPNSLSLNSTGLSNVAIGNRSLENSTGGGGNTAIGNLSLSGITTGQNNIAIGGGSGFIITTGSNNTIIGGYAGTTTLSNNIVLADGAGNVRYQWDGTNNVFGNPISGTSASFSSSVTASSLIKSGGTSSQFLKADGSVDTNTYLTTSAASSTYLPLAGGTLTGALSGTSATFSTDLVVNGWLRPNSIYAFTADAGTTYIQQPSGGNIVLRKSDSTVFLNIANSGAATFSSSVTANQISSIVTSGTARVTIGDGAVSGGALLNIAGVSGGKTWFISSNYNIGGGLEFIQSTTNGGTTPSSSAAMAITSAGNVGIGTSSPAAKLEIAKAGTSFGVPSSAGISISAGGGVGEYNQILFGYSAGDVSPAMMGYVTTDGAGSTKGALVFGTRDVTTASAPTERMRITSVGNTQPGTDNAYSLGVSGTRWSAVWAANGTIQTSDEREKKDIVECDLGLDFVSKLRPVSYKWIVGKNVATSEIVKDEEGNPILDEDGKEKTESVITPIEGKRTHYGLIAQEVEALLDGKDFGGFIHDEETDIKGLRYDQFVPLLIKSIQELQAKIVTLESKIN